MYLVLGMAGVRNDVPTLPITCYRVSPHHAADALILILGLLYECPTASLRLPNIHGFVQSDVVLICS